MSSTYRILCLSHNPAIETGVEWGAGTDNRAASAKAAHMDVGPHGLCDLVVARYSYPLLEVSASLHENAEWFDVEVLRLLQEARVRGFHEPARRLNKVWSPARLSALSSELREHV